MYAGGVGLTDCDGHTGNTIMPDTQPDLTALKIWLLTVASFDFWVFNVWPVVGSLFVNGYKGVNNRLRFKIQISV